MNDQRKREHDGPTNPPRLRVTDLHVSYADRSGWRPLSGRAPRVKAVRGVDLAIARGACLGLVGESGCGKSTLARAIMRLVPIDRGSICLDGQDMSAPPRDQSKVMRRRVQKVFQNAHFSMNPRMTVESIVSDPLRFHERCSQDERTHRVSDVLDVVGLDEALRSRYPHELSGGQLQRVAIARALVLNPDVLVCDEPVSALDVSAQVEILAQLRKIQRERNLTMLLITHDLDVAATVCDDLAVMYLGRIIEYGSVGDVASQPKHPYSFFLNAARDMLQSDPSPGSLDRAPVLGGEPPSPVCPPNGCAFHPRCPIATDHCVSQEPRLIQPAGASQSHRAACHHSDRIADLKKLTATG
ncbi:MAG: ABC transporter ATP-binding protein [Phycisphaerae bacterium]|nr:MAG: ABC transporter ATP-binding protein [Phycisphaerae bacterium]